jgi:hypothetical protein
MSSFNVSPAPSVATNTINNYLSVSNKTKTTGHQRSDELGNLPVPPKLVDTIRLPIKKLFLVFDSANNWTCRLNPIIAGVGVVNLDELLITNIPAGSVDFVQLTIESNDRHSIGIDTISNMSGKNSNSVYIAGIGPTINEKYAYTNILSQNREYHQISNLNVSLLSDTGVRLIDPTMRICLWLTVLCGSW